MAVENKQFACIELQVAKDEDTPIPLNLLALYSHDFSEFCLVDIGEDGRFGFKSLPLYWSEPGRHSFLIRTDGRLADLALVKRVSEFFGIATVWGSCGILCPSVLGTPPQECLQASETLCSLKRVI
jgi:hypothetical protein